MTGHRPDRGCRRSRPRESAHPVRRERARGGHLPCGGANLRRIQAARIRPISLTAGTRSSRLPSSAEQDAQTANPGVPIAALTDTIFALESLDGLGVVLPGSIVWELHDDGGQQNDFEQDGIDWVKHVLSAQAPAGTVSVRVRAGMSDGEFNVDALHQNVFFDDFSLTKSVPEPATLTLTGLGFALAAVARRRRR